MGAKHQKTALDYMREKGIKPLNSTQIPTQKVFNYQLPYSIEPRPVSGGGFQTGGGAAFPILYPIIDLGDLTAANVTLNLADQTLHYQKMNIKKVGGTITFAFDGLVKDRSVVLTLDVTIGVTGVATINWPSNLFNVPAGLPTTNGSRYILYITGFRDQGEERYYVVNSSTGGSVSTLWSDVTIDIDKDMQGKGLFDLGYVELVGDTPAHHTRYSMIANYNAINLTDVDHTNIGFVWEINGGGFFQIIHNTAATPYTDFLYAQVPFNMNNHIIYNIDDLRFNSTGNSQQINTSGDGKVFNFFVDGLNLMNFSHNGSFIGNAAVLEMFSNSSDSTSFPSYKVVNVKTPAVNGRLIGEYAFDGPNSAGTQITYAKIQGFTANVPAGSEAGLFSFFVLHSGSMEEIIELSQNGLDLLNHNLIEAQNIQFNSSGTSSLTARQIYGGSTGLHFQVPNTTDSFFWDFHGVQKVKFDGNANQMILGPAFSLSLFDGSINASISKLASTPMEFNCPSGMQFEVGAAVPLVITSSSVYSTGLSVNLGDSSFFWLSTFSVRYYIGQTTNYLSNDGFGNTYFSQSSNTLFDFKFGGTTQLEIDNINNFLRFKGALSGISIDQGSQSGQIFKLGGGFPMELFCNDLIQLDNHLIPQNSNIQSIGTTTVPFFSTFILNHNIIAGSGSSQFMKQNISGNFHNFLFNTSATNTGYNFQIGLTQYLQIVHNTGNNPVDFLYAQVPLWMVQTYIQLDEISDPSTPPTDKARLYIKDNGSGKSALVIKWESGTVTTIVTEP